MVALTEQQIQALCRFNRTFAVVVVELASVDETEGNHVRVNAKLKHDIVKRFTLDEKGALVKNGATANT
jgi:hypothetical protein